MPTYFRADRFIKDWELLEDADKARFRAAVAQFIEDLDAIRRFAGDELTRAKYYDFDPDFLLELEPEVTHF